jgi:Flp pilus assembly protein TadB
MTSVLAALGTGLCVAGLLWMLLDPPVRLHGRVAPYLARNRPFELWRARVGRRSDPRTVAGFVLSTIAEHVGDVVDGLSRDALLRRLRQARLFQETDDPAATYRVRQLLSVSGACAGSGAVAGIVGMPLGQVAAVVGLGLVVGATRQRGRGEVVEELREALRLHRAGQPAAVAFRRIADETPETSCARTYGFLALAEERGTDLADALLSLAEDVRESRREAIRRAATKRRAAMLIPTIAILAPVMLLFVGAPLPSLVLGFS